MEGVQMGKYRKTITLDPKFWVYIRQQAEVRGISMAKFIEHLIKSEMHQNAPTACVSEKIN